MAAKAKKQLAENTEEEEIIEDDYIPEQDETDDDKKKLEQIVKQFETKYKGTKFIDQQEFYEATSFLDVSDEQYIKIFEKFKKAGKTILEVIKTAGKVLLIVGLATGTPEAAVVAGTIKANNNDY